MPGVVLSKSVCVVFCYRMFTPNEDSLNQKWCTVWYPPGRVLHGYPCFLGRSFAVLGIRSEHDGLISKLYLGTDTMQPEELEDMGDSCTSSPQ